MRKEILGKYVWRVDHGLPHARVLAVEFDDDLRPVSWYLQAKGLWHSVRQYPWEAVIINNRRFFLSYEKPVRKTKSVKQSMLGEPVLNQGGLEIGRLDDVAIRLLDAEVEKLQISHGFFQDVLTGKSLVEPFEVAYAEKQLVLRRGERL